MTFVMGTSVNIAMRQLYRECRAICFIDDLRLGSNLSAIR